MRRPCFKSGRCTMNQKQRKRWLSLLAALLLLPVLAACGPGRAESCYGRVTEVQRAPDGSLSALVLDTGDEARTCVLLTPETLWPPRWRTFSLKRRSWRIPLWVSRSPSSFPSHRQGRDPVLRPNSRFPVGGGRPVSGGPHPVRRNGAGGVGHRLSGEAIPAVRWDGTAPGVPTPN